MRPHSPRTASFQAVAVAHGHRPAPAAVPAMAVLLVPCQIGDMRQVEEEKTEAGEEGGNENEEMKRFLGGGSRRLKD